MVQVDHSGLSVYDLARAHPFPKEHVSFYASSLGLKTLEQLRGHGGDGKGGEDSGRRGRGQRAQLHTESHTSRWEGRGGLAK